MLGVLALLFLVAEPAWAQSWNATLQWTDNAPDETGRRVERQDGSTSAPWMPQADLAPNTTVFQQGGLASGTMYCYRTVVMKGALSTISTPSCSTTGTPGTPPAADTGFILTYTPGSTLGQPARQFQPQPTQRPAQPPLPRPPGQPIPR